MHCEFDIFKTHSYVSLLNRSRQLDPGRDWAVFSDLYAVLNNYGVFADFSRTLSISVVALEEPPRGIGLMKFLWQVILGKGLGRRMENFPDVGIAGFTDGIQTTLIVSDLWVRNVELVVVEAVQAEELAKQQEYEAKKLSNKSVEKTINEEKAEVLKRQGNVSISKKDW